MVLLGLLAAGALLVVLTALVASMRLRRRRSDAQGCVSEKEARENAAPLTTAILSGSRNHENTSP